MLNSRMSAAFNILAALLCCLPVLTGCRDNENADAPKPHVSTPVSAEQLAQIKTFCAHCHAFPSPNSFPREAWDAEVAQGFRLFRESPTEGLVVPPEDVTRAWFESQAPESFPTDGAVDVAETDLFRIQDAWISPETSGIAVSCVRYDKERRQLWSCDMNDGSLYSAGHGEPLIRVSRPLELVNPCRILPADIDGDGDDEVLVSELGSFFPEDHQKGAVWAFSADEQWKATAILQSAARVSDVQTADLDADGDTDLVVAEFGWRKTGSILILWNDGDGTWRKSVLDERHGAIDVPVVDLNEDGRPDILAVIAQEHETVVAYINAGGGQFEPKTLYEAGDPAFGSSGIQIADIDADGDPDILHTNGDSFDDGYLKPFHGMRWLENVGNLSFVPHELARMPGVHRALVADLDMDSDMDVVAVSLLPPDAEGAALEKASVIWLEQMPSGEFQRHVVEVRSANHADCELVDWDSDGDLDLCVAHFAWGNSAGRAISWFENLTVSHP